MPSTRFTCEGCDKRFVIRKGLQPGRAYSWQCRCGARTVLAGAAEFAPREGGVTARGSGETLPIAVCLAATGDAFDSLQVAVSALTEAVASPDDEVPDGPLEASA